MMTYALGVGTTHNLDNPGIFLTISPHFKVCVRGGGGGGVGW